jgi:hypothetical protein
MKVSMSICAQYAASGGAAGSRERPSSDGSVRSTRSAEIAPLRVPVTPSPSRPVPMPAFLEGFWRDPASMSVRRSPLAPPGRQRRRNPVFADIEPLGMNLDPASFGRPH